MTEETTEQPKPDAPRVIMLPPTLVLQHICAGITLNWVMNGFFTLSFGHAWGWIGLILLITAFTLTGWSRKLFQKAGTNVPPNKPATAIVTNGAYKFTRNPMYLSFVAGFCGLAALADAPAMLLVAFPLWYILDRHVITPEEEYLTEKFGDEYLDYKKQVRRWI